MKTLFIILISLLPVTAFAGAYEDLKNFRPGPTPPVTGTIVIPNGHGGVSYWQGQGGTDAGTAAIIGQGMTKQFAPNTMPLHDRPLLQHTPNRSVLDYYNNNR